MKHYLDRIKEVRTEMRRLETRLYELEVAHRISPATYGLHHYRIQTGAIRRASMDLTRSLAKLRKPYE